MGTWADFKGRIWLEFALNIWKLVLYGIEMIFDGFLLIFYASTVIFNAIIWGLQLPISVD